MDLISHARRLVLRRLPLLLLLVTAGCQRQAPSSGDYLFCFWNTENFFDNHVNGWRDEADKKFDQWFADKPEVFEQKVKNLTEVLAALNDGKGPDILALAEVEVESTAAEALKDSLNKAIKPGTPPYSNILKKNPHGGRNIATVILTRLPVVGNRTQLLGKRLRILEGHLDVGGNELIVVASHWTSRLTDKDGHGRAKYGDQIHGRYRAMHKSNPDVSFLVCGDFNDNPDDVSVTEHLHAVGDRNAVLANPDPPLLYNVFASLWAENKNSKTVGTLFHDGKGGIFDQIAVSPSMIDGKGAWQCRTDTVRIVTKPERFVPTHGRGKGHPRRFGSVSAKTPLAKRGYSDHLPVTVRLHLGHE